MNSEIKILTVIQARTGSSRLPCKILLPLADKPLLIRMLERVNTSPLTGKVIAAIPDTEEDDPLFEFCRNNNIEVFRGHSTDLLDRHYKAGLFYNADAVVKIPSDCPLIDPAVITKVLNYFINNPGYDYISNLHPPTYPDGNDVEIFTMRALETCHRKASLPMEREHTTPYMWEHPDQFRTGNVTWETGLDYSMTERWTIDYTEDYIFIKEIYERLYFNNPLFGLNDILSLLDAYPELRQINKKYLGVNWYRNHLHELRTIRPDQTKVL